MVLLVQQQPLQLLLLLVVVLLVLVVVLLLLLAVVAAVVAVVAAVVAAAVVAVQLSCSCGVGWKKIPLDDQSVSGWSLAERLPGFRSGGGCRIYRRAGLRLER